MTATAAISPRWTRRKAARPSEIRDAALELFVQQGFAKTRVEELLSFWPGEYQIFDLETKQAVLTASELSDVADAIPVSNCAE